MTEQPEQPRNPTNLCGCGHFHSGGHEDAGCNGRGLPCRDAHDWFAAAAPEQDEAVRLAAEAVDATWSDEGDGITWRDPDHTEALIALRAALAAARDTRYNAALIEYSRPLASPPPVPAALDEWDEKRLAKALAYAFVRTPLPADTETSLDYAMRLAPLVLESGYLTARLSHQSEDA